MTANDAVQDVLSKTRRVLTSQERPKSVLYLKLKKREVFKIVKKGPPALFETYYSQKTQNIFFGKKLVIFEKVFSFKKSSRIVPKNVEGGTLWDLLTYIQLQNLKKTRRGHPFETLNFFSKKKSHSAEKNPKGGPFRHVRFCRFS